MPFFSIRKQGYITMQGAGAYLQQLSSATDASMTWLLKQTAPAAYQQTFFALVGHFQRAELDSAANSREKHYSVLQSILLCCTMHQLVENYS
jgi:hypothetical protein